MEELVMDEEESEELGANVHGVVNGSRWINVLRENHLFSDRDGKEPCAGAMRCGSSLRICPRRRHCCRCWTIDKRRRWRGLAAERWLESEMDGGWTLQEG